MADVNDDIAQLRKDIENLQSDMGTLLHTFKEEGVEKGRRAYARTKSSGRRAREEAEELEHLAEGQIGSHPFSSVLTSFGLGFMIGMLLDRRH